VIRSLTHAHVMNPAVYDTTPLICILDEDVGTGPPTPFSPEKRYVVRPSMVDPESQLAVGNGIICRDSIQGAFATHGHPTRSSDHADLTWSTNHDVDHDMRIINRYNHPGLQVLMYLLQV